MAEDTQLGGFLLPDHRPDYDEFVAPVRRANWLAMALAGALLVIAVVVWGTNPWAGLLYIIVGLVQLVIAALLLYRLRNRDSARSAGNVVVQHSWALLSFGIATAAIAPSDFFAVGTLWLSLVVLIGFVWTVVGLYNIYWSTQTVNARLTV